MENTRFDELFLSEEMQRAIAEMGFENATPIQARSIPFGLEGKDILGQAQTGTGKTAAFGIPLLEQIDTMNKQPQALVLCPTRELAVQIAEEFKKLSKYKTGLHIAAIYGGDSMDRQLRELRRGVQVVVGTPGRVMDHLNRGTLRTENMRIIVLDEADEMLNMGFKEDIEEILQQLPEERQTMLFSATMSAPILELTKTYQTSPQHVKIAKSELSVPLISQFYFNVKSSQKVEVMARLVEMHDLKLMLVFCNTKKKVDELVEELQQRGLGAEGLHGDMKQMQRNAVMGRFRNSTVNVLVATDVAARGIDVTGVDAVFNYDLPQDPEYYVHRIGRTGRAGQRGMSFTFVTGKESLKLREIERYSKTRIDKGEIPGKEAIMAARQQRFAEQIKTEIKKGDLSQYDEMIAQLVKDGFELRDITASLLRMQIGVLKQEFSDELSQNGGGYDEPRHKNAKMVRLFVNLGKNQKIGKGDIVGALAGETGMKGSLIGNIDIFDKYSFVEIPESEVKRVLRAMDNNTIKGKRVNFEIAKN